MVAAFEKVGVRIWWFDQIIDDICVRKDHLILKRKEEQLLIKLAELQDEADRV